MLSKKYFAVLFCLASSAVFAATCPPAALIKVAVFNHAEIYDGSLGLWELISEPFNYDGKLWNVSYGLTIKNAGNEVEAVELGRQRYQRDQVLYPNPPADPIPGYLFCDYTNSTVPYWIQALTPPGK